MKKHLKAMLSRSAVTMLETLCATSIVIVMLGEKNWLVAVTASIVAGLLQALMYLAENE